MFLGKWCLFLEKNKFVSLWEITGRIYQLKIIICTRYFGRCFFKQLCFFFSKKWYKFILKFIINFESHVLLISQYIIHINFFNCASFHSSETMTADLLSRCSSLCPWVNICVCTCTYIVNKNRMIEFCYLFDWLNVLRVLFCDIQYSCIASYF